LRISLSSRAALLIRKGDVENCIKRVTERERERERKKKGLPALTFKSTLGEQLESGAVRCARSEDEERSGTESRGLDNFSCPLSRKLGGSVLTIRQRRNEGGYGRGGV